MCTVLWSHFLMHLKSYHRKVSTEIFHNCSQHVFSNSFYSTPSLLQPARQPNVAKYISNRSTFQSFLITPYNWLHRLSTLNCVTDVAGVPTTRRERSGGTTRTAQKKKKKKKRTADWRRRPQWYRQYEGTSRKDRDLIRNNKLCQEVKGV